MKLQYQYYVEVPRLSETMQLDDTLVSEIRKYEEANIPEPDRVISVRKGSVDMTIGHRIPKTYEEAEIEGI